MAMKLATIKVAQKADVFLTDEFKNHILNKLRDDDCGHLVRTDLRILEFGSILYDRIKRTLEKEVEIRKQVRSDMRQLVTFFSLLSKV